MSLELGQTQLADFLYIFIVCLQASIADFIGKNMGEPIESLQYLHGNILELILKRTRCIQLQSE